MKSASKHALSLSQQNAIRLALVFVLFEILVALAVAFFSCCPWPAARPATWPV